MKNLTFLILVFALFSCVNKNTENNNQKMEDELQILVIKEVEKLAGNFNFTEGPAVDALGNVYFTDIPNNRIFIWTVDNKLDTFNQNSGGANGLYFDEGQNLLACEGKRGRLSSTSSDGEYNVIAKEFEGKGFNQPNDLWPDGKGGIYFTDPKYGEDDSELPQDGMHVYYIKPDRTSIIRVCDDFEKPNGIIGTPDGKILYVTDNGGGRTYKYDILEDGSLINKTLFVEFGSDGMTIDREGNVYLTTNGKLAVDVFSVSGELVESIEVPEKPANVCFGGEDRNLLYITARTSIYRVELNKVGVD